MFFTLCYTCLNVKYIFFYNVYNYANFEIGFNNFNQRSIVFLLCTCRRRWFNPCYLWVVYTEAYLKRKWPGVNRECIFFYSWELLSWINHLSQGLSFAPLWASTLTYLSVISNVAPETESDVHQLIHISSSMAKRAGCSFQVNYNSTHRLMAVDLSRDKLSNQKVQSKLR